MICRTGTHQATIRISVSNGTQAEPTTSFEIDNHAFEMGRIIGRLVKPLRGATSSGANPSPLTGRALVLLGHQADRAFVGGEPAVELVIASSART